MLPIMSRKLWLQPRALCFRLRRRKHNPRVPIRPRPMTPGADGECPGTPQLQLPSGASLVGALRRGAVVPAALVPPTLGSLSTVLVGFDVPPVESNVFATTAVPPVELAPPVFACPPVPGRRAPPVPSAPPKPTSPPTPPVARDPPMLASPPMAAREPPVEDAPPTLEAPPAPPWPVLAVTWRKHLAQLIALLRRPAEFSSTIVTVVELTTTSTSATWPVVASAPHDPGANTMRSP